MRILENEQLTDIKQLEGAIEAILFAAGHPMEYSKIGDVLGLATGDTKRLVSHLADRINSNDCGGILLLCFEDSCQLCTNERYMPYIREALGIKRGGNLSASSLEVLAIAAYNQPVTRAFIDTVRGVDSAYAVGSLLDKELIAPVGRLDAPGRPMLYGTTDKFLRVFGLSSIKELPEASSVLAAVTALSNKSDDDSGDDEKDTEASADHGNTESENT